MLRVHWSQLLPHPGDADLLQIKLDVVHGEGVQSLELLISLESAEELAAAIQAAREMRQQCDKRNAVALLIEHLGGVTRTAEAFGVRPPSVCEWHDRGQLPVGRCWPAEKLTGGKFTRYQLRPDLFGPAPESEAA